MISLVVRTYNEEKHLPALLDAVRRQSIDLPVEVVLVDSGSADQTVQIADAAGCRIVRIEKKRFSFGRSLNIGCAAANGDMLVFVSGHCIPIGDDWLRNLIAPLRSNDAVYVYGRQVGGKETKYSEMRHFCRYFPPYSAVPQEGFFCNNANAAMPKSVWQEHPFDEGLTGLEDMAQAKALVSRGKRIGYVAEAVVRHLHDESWRTIKNRYEREAIALQGILPQVHITFGDFMRYFMSAVLHDAGSALKERRLIATLFEIVAYRLMQFWGSYRGNNEHRKLSQIMKDKYFYPR